MPQLRDIRIRDPFILFVPDEDAYYLFGTTDPSPWGGPGTGFDTYRSTDLEDWSGPLPAFRPPSDFWATTQFWAPEVHTHNGRYIMLASFADDSGRRGTQALSADSPAGPYTPWSPTPLTPPNWLCLDGTLFRDANDDPWLVFCHEWLQIGDGAIYAQRLSHDLRRTTSTPQLLFTASTAPWARSTPDAIGKRKGPAYVTDGPFLYRAGDELRMLWSSYGENGYAMGVATSESGTIAGPWHHDNQPLWGQDGGHGMILNTRESKTLLVFHHPNNVPDERTQLVELTPAPTPPPEHPAMTQRKTLTPVR